MFKDYYAVLEISKNANPEEIKSAFKKQALKWHPDRNPEADTTSKMQVINEAKLILLDSEARSKYDIEYERYHSEKQKKEQEYYAKENGPQRTSKSSGHQFEDFEDNNYKIYDEELHKWMANAKKQSVELAKKTIEDFKGMVKAGSKEAAKGAVNAIATQIVLGIIISIFIALSRTCNN